MKRIIFSITFVFVIGAFLFVSSAGFSDGEDTEELKAQIKALQQRVDELEAQQGAAGTQNPYQHRGWDPFAQMQRMQEDMDTLFSQAFSAQAAAPNGTFSTNMIFDQQLNLKETNEGYEIRFDMTGIDKDKMDIQINQNSITVSGQYSEQHQEESQNSVIQSQRFGTFLKTIPVPADADTANIKTEQQGDELVITMPRK